MNSRAKRVMKFLSGEGPSTFNEATRALDGDVLSTVVALHDLFVEKCVKTVGDLESRQGLMYCLTDKGARLVGDSN